jgi:hypothetical protein
MHLEGIENSSLTLAGADTPIFSSSSIPFYMLGNRVSENVRSL